MVLTTSTMECIKLLNVNTTITIKLYHINSVVRICVKVVLYVMVTTEGTQEGHGHNHDRDQQMRRHHHHIDDAYIGLAGAVVEA